MPNKALVFVAAAVLEARDQPSTYSSRRPGRHVPTIVDQVVSFTRRRGRLYRYYVCLGASRRGHDTCPVRSIAASEVESLVLAQVRRLLASPELVARTISAVRRENGAAEDTKLEEGDVIEALGALEPVWDELYPAEQARILRLLIARIDVAPSGLSVTLHAAGVRSLVAELADQEPPAPAASEALLEAAE
jgi:site-specific DNA recombinase